MVNKAQHILAQMGKQIQQIRLNRNLRLDDLANELNLSRNTVAKLEKGKGTLENYVSLLMLLGIEDRLNSLIVEEDVSPMQQLKLAGKKRQRARATDPSSALSNSNKKSEW